MLESVLNKSLENQTPIRFVCQYPKLNRNYPGNWGILPTSKQRKFMWKCNNKYFKSSMFFESVVENTNEIFEVSCHKKQ